MLNLLPALILLILQGPGSAMVEPGQPAWKSVIGAQALAEADTDAIGVGALTSSGSTSFCQLLRWCAFIAVLGDDVAPAQAPIAFENTPKQGFAEPIWKLFGSGFLTPGRTRDGPVFG